MKDYYKEALKLHEVNKGKLEIKGKVSLNTREDLSIAYTPGVAEPCREIQKNRENIYKYTMKGNLVAVVSDGSAVLGLGNIGAEASIPVMEGKALLFKKFAGIDAVPICIKSQNIDEIVNIIENIASTFGGINLEDFSAPRCFEIEEKLIERLDIPVFHDDQHGTAVVTCAALINSLKIVKKEIGKVRIVVNGAGAAGTAIVKMLLCLGAKDIVVSDINGILNREDRNLTPHNKNLSEITNHSLLKGRVEVALQGADVFIGVSAGNIITKEMISSMNKDAIVFAMANPEPEIYPEEAKKGGARIVGTGRSDFPNQINNVLAFPGIFKGALKIGAKVINDKMKIAASYAIAKTVKDENLNEDHIIPDIFYPDLSEIVANAVMKAYEDKHSENI